MKKRKLFFYLMVLQSVVVYAQSVLIGGGFVFAYRSGFQEQGAKIVVRFKDRLEVETGYSFRGKFNGNGFAGGARYLFLKKSIQPFVGVGSSFNSGRRVNLVSDGVKGSYFVSESSFVYGETGLFLKYEPDNYSGSIFRGVLLFGLHVTYRQSINTPVVKFVDGTHSKIAENNLNKRVGDGIGGAISLTVLIGKEPGN
jgi:hypothetical protein